MHFMNFVIKKCPREYKEKNFYMLLHFSALLVLGYVVEMR